MICHWICKFRDSWKTEQSLHLFQKYKYRKWLIWKSPIKTQQFSDLTGLWWTWRQTNLIALFLTVYGCDHYDFNIVCLNLSKVEDFQDHALSCCTTCNQKMKKGLSWYSWPCSFISDSFNKDRQIWWRWTKLLTHFFRNHSFQIL